MKIIHTADLHLDSSFLTNLSGRQAISRRKELLGNVARLFDYAEKEQVRAILIAGDLFDSDIISDSAVTYVYHQIVTHPEIMVFYLGGNHDGDGFLEGIHEFPDNLYVFSEDWTSYEIQTENGSIFITGAEFESGENLPYNKLNLDPYSFEIVMLHGQLSEGNVVQTGCISKNSLKNKNIDYLALGHIHQRCEGRLDERGIYCYCGCLEARGFDECGEHGFMLLDIDEKTGCFEKTFVPFAKRRAAEIGVDLTGASDMTEVMNRIARKLAQDSKQRSEQDAGQDARQNARRDAGQNADQNAPLLTKDDMVCLLLTGKISEYLEIDENVISASFEDDFYLFRLKNETRIIVDYEKYRNDCSLKGEYIRQIEAADGLTEEEKGELIKMGVRALEGEDIFD